MFVDFGHTHDLLLVAADDITAKFY